MYKKSLKYYTQEESIEMYFLLSSDSENWRWRQWSVTQQIEGGYFIIVSQIFDNEVSSET